MLGAQEGRDRGARLEVEAQLLHEVAERAPVLVWGMTLDGRCTYVLGSVLERLGATREDLVGRSAAALAGGDTVLTVMLGRAAEGGELTTELAGSTFSVSWQPRPARDGQVEEVVCVAIDVGDSLRRTELERELAGQQRAQALQLLAAQEFERSQLAQGMHDDTVQVLSAIDLRLDLLRHRLAGTATPELTAEAAELGTLLRQAVDRLRSLIFALEPPSTNAPLATALAALGDELLRPAGVAQSVDVAVPASLPEHVRSSLLGVAREAMSNVARHSGARTAAVRLTSEGPGIAFSLEDDGVGVPASLQEQPGHRGLRGMRERLALVAGTLEVTARPGGGTAVRAWVPVRLPPALGGSVTGGLREPLREVLDSVDEAFLAVDRDWQVLFVNRSAGLLLESEPASLEGGDLWRQLPELVGTVVELQAHRAADEQRPVQVVLVRGGRFVDIRLLPSPQGMFAFFRDVTAERAALGDPGAAGGAGSVLLAALTDENDPGTATELFAGLATRVVRSGSLLRVTVTDRSGGVLSDSGPPTPDRGARTRTVVVDEPLPRKEGGRLTVETTDGERPASRWLVMVLAALAARTLDVRPTGRR